MDEVDAQAVDLGTELGELVDPGLRRSPVVLLGPVATELLGVGQRDPLGPVVDGLGLGPAGAAESVDQVRQLGVRCLDPERFNRAQRTPPRSAQAGDCHRIAPSPAIVTAVWDDAGVSPPNDTADTAGATVAEWLDDCLDAAPAVPTGELDQLRIQLEEAAAAALEVLGGVATGPIRLPKGLLANLARCERLARSADSPSSIGGPAMMRGTALDHFIVHRLRSGPVTAPGDELGSMLRVEADHERADELSAMTPDAAAELLTPLAGAAEFFADVDPGWWPRSQSPASVVLAGGRVVCSGRIDLEFGGPLTGRPALAIEVKSGSFRGEHAAEAHLYALLMSMRDGVAPVAVGLWYPGTSVLGFPVSIGVLRVRHRPAVRRRPPMGRAGGGSVSGREPGGLVSMVPRGGRVPVGLAGAHR